MDRRHFVGGALAGVAALAPSPARSAVKPGDVPMRTFGKTGEKLTVIGQAGGRFPLCESFEQAKAITRRAYDQMMICMGTGPRTNVVIGFTPGIANPARIHHQAAEDLGMTRAIPNATVIDPMDVTDFRQALDAAVDMPGLIYMRGHRGNTPRILDPDKFEFELGKTYKLVDEGLRKAKKILKDFAKELKVIAEGLLEYETLTGQEIKDLLEGKQPIRDTGDDSPKEGGGSAVPVTGKAPAKKPRPKKGGTGDMEPQPQG